MITSIFKIYKSAFSGLDRNSWLLSLVLFINRAGYMVLPFMGLYITQSLHRSTSDAGLIISLFGIGSMLGATAGGKFTDMIGFKTVQIISSVCTGVFFILFAEIKDFQILCILSLVISFFSEAFKPANYSAIAAYSKPQNLTRSYSLNRLATNLGWAFGVSLGGIVASYNYKLLFYIDGIVNIVIGIIIFLLLPNVLIKKAANDNLDKKVKIIPPYKDIVFLKFIVLTIIFAICFFLMFRVVPIFFKEEWNIDEFQIGIILGVNGVLIALFEMVLLYYLENKRKPVFYIIAGTFCVGVSFVFLILPPTMPIVLALACIACFSIGEMLALPFINNFVYTRSNDYNRGQYAGGYTLSWSIASVVGPAAGFYLAETAGYNVLWIFLGICVLLVSLGYYLMGKHFVKV